MEWEFQRRVSGNDQHERYVELCALAATGSLTPSERKELDRHLDTCPECCASLEEFERVVRVGIPLLAENREEIANENRPWSQAEAKQQMFAQINREERHARNRTDGILLPAMRDWSTPLAYVVAGLICVSLLAGG